MRQCENIFVFIDLTKSIGSDLGGSAPPVPPPNSAYALVVNMIAIQYHVVQYIHNKTIKKNIIWLKFLKVCTSREVKKSLLGPTLY